MLLIQHNNLYKNISIIKNMRIGVHAVVIENGKILLVKKDKKWILPGGKPGERELDNECLIREFSEELSGTRVRNLKFYGKFRGPTPKKGDMLDDIVYFAKIDGELGQPSEEISAVEWVGDITGYDISDITSQVIDSLRKGKYL